MTANDLRELLRATAAEGSDAVDLAEDAVVARIQRRRIRTRRYAVTGIALTVAAVIAATTWAVRPGDGHPPAATTPPATRLVGIGHAAIAVPTQWATNQLHCGTPQKDTVIIDAGPQGLCQTPYPKGVESVMVRSGKPIDFHADETFQLDGVRAQRQRTTCPVDSLNRVTVCSGTVFIPSLDVSFQAESSTNADEIHSILARITIIADKVGVPEPLFSESNPAARFGEQYADRLTALGLKPNIQTRKSPGSIPGTVLAVSPSPGTILAPGAPVTVTVPAGSGPGTAEVPPRIVTSDLDGPTGMEAALQARLAVDANGCVRAGAGKPTVTLVWPRGYTVKGDAKSFEILDGANNVVARSGVLLTIDGGGADHFEDTWTGRDCVSGGHLWMVGTIHASR
ncbi:PASTA domain-containing protein [Kribbella sp. NPDC050124]|uniref:PASTA domain-containing protein n=1 Tax=Kribbella sp. NPDC050124 TaxID=3364114 RepID=UPI0037899C31